MQVMSKTSRNQYQTVWNRAPASYSHLEPYLGGHHVEGFERGGFHVEQLPHRVWSFIAAAHHKQHSRHAPDLLVSEVISHPPVYSKLTDAIACFNQREHTYIEPAKTNDHNVQKGVRPLLTGITAALEAMRSDTLPAHSHSRHCRRTNASLSAFQRRWLHECEAADLVPQKGCAADVEEIDGAARGGHRGAALYPEVQDGAPEGQHVLHCAEGGLGSGFAAGAQTLQEAAPDCPDTHHE